MSQPDAIECRHVGGACKWLGGDCKPGWQRLMTGVIRHEVSEEKK